MIMWMFRFVRCKSIFVFIRCMAKYWSCLDKFFLYGVSPVCGCSFKIRHTTRVEYKTYILFNKIYHVKTMKYKQNNTQIRAMNVTDSQTMPLLACHS